MKKLSFIILSIFTILSISRCTTNTGEKDPMYANVDTVFSEFNESTPGCALAIVQDGKIIYETGYGMADLENHIPISPESRFYIGSISKQFVTFSILLLYEAGKLDLDDDVRTYIPEFPDYGYKLTIRHFIHHTSGVRDNLTLWSLRGNSILDEVPEKGILELICRQKELNFEPGSQYLYSNSCYFMLGIIVERVSGKTLNEFAQEQIFQPLEMTSTVFHDNNENLIPDRASGYSFSDNKTVRNQISRYDLVGSGGMFSTVRDLAKWDRNLYANNLGKSDQALIDTMLTDGLLNSGESAGYAFALVNGDYRGLKTVSHSGALGGYKAYYVQFPDQKTSVIILGNFGQFNPGRYAYQVADILLDTDFTEEPLQTEARARSENEKHDFRLDPEDLKRYEGRYYSEELDTYYTLVKENNILQMRVAFNEPVSGIPTYENGFNFNGLEVVFMESNGQVSGFKLNAGRVRNLSFVRAE
jgi:CubicO group peptidase (beta-lactamase class C family)